MADFVTTVTDEGELDADELTKFEEGVIFGYTPELVVDQVATVRSQAAAKTIQFAKYANLSLITSRITDGEEVASVVLADSTATLSPVEYGNAITLQKSADVQSGFKAGAAAGFLIGRNAGASLDKLAMTALEGFSTTQIWPNGKTATTQLTDSDVLDSAFAHRLHNKLARLNVPGINGGMYVGIAHEDLLYDLKMDAGAAGWTEVNKYANPDNVLMNEVGMFAGIRWLRSSNATITSDGGSGTTDSY